MKTREELEEELCEYCELTEDKRGVSSNGNGQPIFYCSNRLCEQAYDYYKDAVENE